MCRFRKALRTNMRWPEDSGDRISERGWCEEICPGLYRSTVSHLGSVPCVMLDEATLAKYPEIDLSNGEDRRLIWGAIFQGRRVDESSVDPEVIIGEDKSPCAD